MLHRAKLYLTNRRFCGIISMFPLRNATVVTPSLCGLSARSCLLTASQKCPCEQSFLLLVELHVLLAKRKPISTIKQNSIALCDFIYHRLLHCACICDDIPLILLQNKKFGISDRGCFWYAVIFRPTCCTEQLSLFKKP